MARTAAAIQAELDKVDECISFILDRRNMSQAAPTGNSFTRLSLNQLRELRKDLRAELEGANATDRPAVVRFAPRPSPTLRD